MPIVNELQGGLRRFAVLSFIEDPDCDSSSYTVLNFPKCPLSSIAEASCKLAHAEFMHMKRLKSIEKNVLCPYVDVTFYSSYQSVGEIYYLVEQTDCKNIYDERMQHQKACYEELQLVDPKRDMVQTPIDKDDPIEEMQNGIGRRASISATEDLDNDNDNTKRERGYIILAYKTMEHMYNREFVTSWKTWTGVRYICMALPRQLALRRISFYRQLNATSTFTYVLLIEISNLLLYAAQTLNLIDRIKLRLCGYVGVYREVDFKLDAVTARNLGLKTDFEYPPKGKPSICVTLHNQKSTDDIEDETLRMTVDRTKRGSIIPKPLPTPDSTPGTPVPIQQPTPPPPVGHKKMHKMKKVERLPSTPESESVPTPQKQSPATRKAKDSPQPRKEKKESTPKKQETTPEHTPIKREAEVEKEAIEAEVHPRPMQPLVRLAGKGRVVQDPTTLNIFPKISEITRPLIQEGEVFQPPVPKHHESRFYHRRRSRDSRDDGERRRSSTVAAGIPNTREMLQSSAYESIFKRNPEAAQAPAPKFSDLPASFYNSPVFSRTEWREQSNMYRNNNFGDNSMASLADRLDRAPETDLVASRNNNEQQGSLVFLAGPPRLAEDRSPKIKEMSESKGKYRRSVTSDDAVLEQQRRKEEQLQRELRNRSYTIENMTPTKPPGAPSPRRRALPTTPKKLDSPSPLAPNPPGQRKSIQNYP